MVTWPRWLVWKNPGVRSVRAGRAGLTDVRAQKDLEKWRDQVIDPLHIPGSRVTNRPDVEYPLESLNQSQRAAVVSSVLWDRVNHAGWVCCGHTLWAVTQDQIGMPGRVRGTSISIWCHISMASA
jgi:hypothetical protein